MNHPTDIVKVYDDHSVRLYNMSLRILGDSFEAEEVMHDTLLQYHASGNKEGIMDLGKWLSSICIRKSIDRLRKRRKFMDFLEEYEDPLSAGTDRFGKARSSRPSGSDRHYPLYIPITPPAFFPI